MSCDARRCSVHAHTIRYARAEQQQDFLDAREDGYKDLLTLKSEATRLVVESALALASLKGALE